MNCLLVGYGEVGKGVYDVFCSHHNITIYDITDDQRPDGEFEVLLVCIPYSDLFIDIVKEYINEYGVKTTIIFSTVRIGTTSQIPNAVHSPIEGVHPMLANSIALMKRFVGGVDRSAISFFELAGMSPVIVEKPEFTEFLKLQSTTNYALMIEYARYVKEVCDDLNMDYDFVKDYNIAYNDLYRELNMDKIKRYILDPPEGNIGGHCLIPNAKILNSQFPSEFLNRIIEENTKDRL